MRELTDVELDRTVTAIVTRCPECGEWTTWRATRRHIRDHTGLRTPKAHGQQTYRRWLGCPEHGGASLWDLTSEQQRWLEDGPSTKNSDWRFGS